MMDRRTFVAAAVALPLAAACAPRPAGTTLERARYDGALRVGISGERPFGYADSAGRVTGAQPEIARAVLARAGVEGIEAVQVTFEKLIPTLLAGQCDLICAGMTITDDRCGQVAFSRPDFVAPPAFLVAEGNPLNLRSFADVARRGIRLAAIAGTVELRYALDAGVRADRVEVVESQRNLRLAVADGKADAGVMTALSLADELRRNPGSGLGITGPLEARTGSRRRIPAGGFAMRTGDHDLLAAFDTGLDALHSSGEWLRIVEPFGFRPVNVPDPGLTTAELCRA